jgi:hypothetical protein
MIFEKPKSREGIVGLELSGGDVVLSELVARLEPANASGEADDERGSSSGGQFRLVVGRELRGVLGRARGDGLGLLGDEVGVGGNVDSGWCRTWGSP